MTAYKTFKDLKVKPHASGDGLHAVIFFPNGYGVSVVRFKTSMISGYGSYTSNETEWELAVIHGNAKSFTLIYDTDITGDVLGYLSDNEVTETMKKVQDLPVRNMEESKHE